ncbi:hypothetical protein DL98DRAFT_596439 [Cadophora sp. DSE1049]|nr:hypothetical protein DL98DRAFT_596439 [Cadophora sp. DSE1049]
MGGRGRGGNGGGRGRGNRNGNDDGNGNRNGNGKGGAGAKTCYICGKGGHVAQDCRSAGQGKKYCTNCKMTNHNTADCTRGGKKGQKQITFDSNNTSTALSTKKVTRPCRFCREMHLDKDCPTKNGGNGTVMTTNQGDSVFRDVFGTPEFTPPCQHCGGQHLSTNCPRIVQQPVDQYQYQRYPAQPVQYVPPAKSLWDACDEIDEEFVVGDPWYPATRMGPVDPNQFPTHYTQEVCAAVHYQQNQNVDRDGDRYVDSMDWEFEDPKQPRW